MSSPTRSRICLHLLLVLFAGQVACAARHARTPSTGLARLEPEEKSLNPYDEPDEARQYYLMKRAGPNGNPVDLVRAYRKAIDRMERMPRYSTRTGRALVSLYEARNSKDPRRLAQGNLLSTWEPVGPGNIGGRTRVILVDPGQPETMYAAGVSGGIWKTEDAGGSWRAVGDLLPNIAVNSMAMDPADTKIIYAGTGEGYFREIVRGTGLPLRGEGIFKTVDGGESWVRLQSTSNSDFYWVNDLVVSRNDSRRIYAATRTGVWRSTDAGQSWTRVLNVEDVTGGCLDLALRTDRSSDYLFATCGTFQQATVYLNTQAELDGSWVAVLSDAGMGRTSLAIAPSNPDIVYALSASYVPGPNGMFDGGLHAVFRSDQGGVLDTWRATVRNTDKTKLNTLLLTNPLAASYRVCGYGSDSYSTMGWYTNVIAVDPRDPEIVFAGGVDLFRSDDGGSNWGPVSHWAESPPSAHADQHGIFFHPDYDGTLNQIMYLGGDGGIWRTDNARAPRSLAAVAPCSRNYSQVRWTPLNHSYGVTQFYHGAPFPDGKTYLGGTQDNGTVLGTEQNGIDGWINVLGGDGGYVAVDFENPSTVYGEYQYLSLRKSSDGGRTFPSSATRGISEPGSGTLFITPFVMDPNNSKRLWLGGHSIWRTSDGAASWIQAGQKLSANAKVSAIAVAASDSERVLVGMNDGSIYRQDQATSSFASTLWPSSQPRHGYVTWLTFDPSDSQVAYAAYADFGGAHVWKTTDGGENWVSIDGEGATGLPDIPVHVVVVDPNHRERLYLGTDLGVFTTRQGGNVWAVENSGFVNVVTESLTLQQLPGAEPVLWAFTHGRGAWRVPLASVPEPPPCTPERWIPHVTPAGVPFETTLFATNFAAVQAQVELVPFRDDGTSMAPVAMIVKPGETRTSSSADLFSKQAVSHFGICGSSSVSITAAYRSAAGSGTSAHVPEVSLRGTEFLFYPGEWDVIFDGMALVNVSSDSSRIEAVLLSEAGTELRRIVLNPALPPYAKQLAVLDYEFRGLHGAAIRIESAQPSTILFLRGTRDASATPALLYHTAPVTRGEDGATVPGPCDPQRWIMHVTPPDAGYDTTILATNFSGADASLELVPFRADGIRLGSIFRLVPAGQSSIALASDLFPGIPISHLGVCGPQSLRVSSSYRYLSGPSATAHVPETSVVDTQFLFYPGEWHVVYEGLAVVNHGTMPGRVEAVLLDADGGEVHRERLIDGLAPGARQLAVLDALFDGYTGVAIRIECSEPSSILLLRGTKPGLQPMVLFQTVPIAITPRR
ncbi:MAG: hypothetical protein LAP85_13775 [Acidobacteriia bacterium]|nr:hypothetical protein [Terriglobia bacterium]